MDQWSDPTWLLLCIEQINGEDRMELKGLREVRRKKEMQIGFGIKNSGREISNIERPLVVSSCFL